MNFSLFSICLEHGANLRLYNPLSDVCQNPKGTVDMIKLLQSKGVQLIEPNDPMNSLSLSSNPNADIYFYLLQNGATFSKTTKLNFLESQKKEILDDFMKKTDETEKLQYFDVACRYDLYGAIEALVDYLDPEKNLLILRSFKKFGFSYGVIKRLLSKGVNINQTDGEDTLLTILCRRINNYFDEVKFLVEHGAKIDDKAIRNASSNPSYANYLKKRRYWYS